MQKFMSFLIKKISFCIWVLMEKAWICLRSLKDLHLGTRERGSIGVNVSFLECFELKFWQEKGPTASNGV